MAPMRWQGGDRAPSRNRSLLCRLILNWPDPLTGTGILRKRHTDGDSKHWITEEACFGKKEKKHWTGRYKYLYREQLRQDGMFSLFNKKQPVLTTLRSSYNYIQSIGTFHVSN